MFGRSVMEEFKDQDLQFKNLVNDFEKKDAYRLRHQVFVEELGWVPPQEDAMEIDNYDKDCVLVGLYARSELIACLRILLPYQKFMIEKEFKEIAGEHKVEKTEDTIEVTRFCVSGRVRKCQVDTRYGKFPVVMALEKAFYNWCRYNGMDTVYMVVSKNFLRLLNLLGMPCNSVAPPVKMPDGVTAVAAISSWTSFEDYNKKKRPNLLAWFQDCDQFGEVKKNAV